MASSPASHCCGDDITPDPTFYRSPSAAAAAAKETLAYVAVFSRAATQPDAIAVLDVDSSSQTYGTIVGFTELPHLGDEVHHFGWNACSAALDPRGSHCDSKTSRQYLIVPGLRSSRIYIIDISQDPRNPKIVKEISAEELGEKTGYSRPHTVHCGPGAVFVSALGGHGTEGPGGIALLDNKTFEPTGAWEKERGEQTLAYDVWWHLLADVAVTSEWGTPSMVENGIVPELLLGKKYGHSLHFWDMKTRNLVQSVDLGDNEQMVLELRPAHDPTKK
jgi:selenium-binding protein 1